MGKAHTRSVVLQYNAHVLIKSKKKKWHALIKGPQPKLGSDGGKKAAADQTSTTHTDIWGLKTRFLESAASRVDRPEAPRLHLTSQGHHMHWWV